MGLKGSSGIENLCEGSSPSVAPRRPAARQRVRRKTHRQHGRQSGHFRNQEKSGWLSIARLSPPDTIRFPGHLPASDLGSAFTDRAHPDNVQAFIRRASSMADKTSWTKPLACMTYGDSIVGGGARSRANAGGGGGAEGRGRGRGSRAARESSGCHPARGPRPVDVHVLGEGLAPGVEHGGTAQITAEVARVTAEAQEHGVRRSGTGGGRSAWRDHRRPTE